MKNQLKVDMVSDEDMMEVVVFDDSDNVDWTPVFEMARRREWSKANPKPCPKCGTMQVQLVDWSTDRLKMKCRHCKHVHFRDVRPEPVGCEAYCMCPACMGPDHEEWYAKGSPTLCQDGKVHLMTRPGYPVEEIK